MATKASQANPGEAPREPTTQDATEIATAAAEAASKEQTTEGAQAAAQGAAQARADELNIKLPPEAIEAVAHATAAATIGQLEERGAFKVPEPTPATSEGQTPAERMEHGAPEPEAAPTKKSWAARFLGEG